MVCLPQAAPHRCPSPATATSLAMAPHTTTPRPTCTTPTKSSVSGFTTHTADRPRTRHRVVQAVVAPAEAIPTRNSPQPPLPASTTPLPLPRLTTQPRITRSTPRFSLSTHILRPRHPRSSHSNLTSRRPLMRVRVAVGEVGFPPGVAARARPMKHLYTRG